MAKFIGFIQSDVGRLVRIVLGIAMIVIGAAVLQAPVGYIVMLAGLVPLAAGLVGICLVGPLFGYTLSGNRRMHHA